MCNTICCTIRKLPFLVVVSINLSAMCAEFFPLGDLPGGKFHSYADGLSDDGSVVVGYSEYSVDGIDREAFLWSEETGMIGLGRLDFRFSKATDASADGSTVAGYVDFPGPRQAFRWTQSDGIEIIGSGRTGTVSPDGSIIFAWDQNGDYMWSEETGRQPVTEPPSEGPAILLREGNTYSLWAPSSAPIEIDQLEGRHVGMIPLEISKEGNVVVGQIRTTLDLPNRPEAFRWTETTGTVALGDLPGGPFRSAAYGVSGDGSMVVGHANMEDGWVGGDAFIWDTDNGMRSLQDVLVQDYGLASSLQGWNLHHANSISADGNVIVGYGTNPQGHTEAWRVVLDTLAGDYDGNGVLDADDLKLQADAMQSGDLNFDENGDSRVDIEDRTLWVKDYFGSWLGDSNLDGEFNSGDMVTVFVAGKYQLQTDAEWTEGDWTGDRRFDSGDLVAAFQDGGYEIGPRLVLCKYLNQLRLFCFLSVFFA